MSDFKKRVMRRVYLTWFWRSVAPLLVVELVLLAGVGIGVITHISVKSILMNALNASADARAFVLFFVNNFFVKSIQSRLLVVAFAAVLFFFARDLRNALKRLSSYTSEDLFAAIAMPGSRR